MKTGGETPNKKPTGALALTLTELTNRARLIVWVMGMVRSAPMVFVVVAGAAGVGHAIERFVVAIVAKLAEELDFEERLC